MSKDKLRQGVDHQMDQTAREVPPENRAITGKRGPRDVRLVVRLNDDEFRRLSRYAEDKHLAVSTAVRSLAMDGIRKA